jgi:hypothetical protein
MIPGDILSALQNLPHHGDLFFLMTRAGCRAEVDSDTPITTIILYCPFALQCSYG